MRAPRVAAVFEARNVVKAFREHQKAAAVGPLVVSGMLAEQLAKELARDATPGSIAVAEDPGGMRSPVAIRIIAGSPTAEDDEFVRTAERAEVPVVIVQLWPQENWREPYVLSPFVVECKAGEGFPIEAIAAQIATAAGDPVALAAGIPVLEPTVVRAIERDSIIRSALVAAATGRQGARAVLALEQTGMLARLHALGAARRHADEELPLAAGIAGATLAASYGFRELARRTRAVVPTRLVDAAVAAAGTWLLAETFRRLEAKRL
jgi:hypothetical protein